MVFDNMVLRVLALALGLVQVSMASNCLKYTCRPPDQQWHERQCAYFDANTSTLYADYQCSKDEYCPVIDTNATCTPVYLHIGYPGDLCKKNYTCDGGCKHGLCMGGELGDGCGGFIDGCSPGYSCHQKCERALEEGDECTWSGYCLPGLECYTVAYRTFECQRTLAIGPGHKATLCQGTGKCSLCKHLYSGVDKEGVVRCLEPLKSLHPLPMKCVEDSDCLSEVDPLTQQQFTGQCRCGKNPEGQAYCTLFPGDKYYKRWLQLYREWINSSKFREFCSESEFRDHLCFQAMKDHWYADDADEAWYYYMRSQYYPEFVDIKPCIRKAFFSTYMSTPGYEDDDPAFMLSAVEA